MKIVTLVVSFATFAVAALQFILAREKFKLDSFDKRFAVFKAIETFFNDAIRDRHVTTENLIKFDTGTQTASFLFPDEIVNFISEIRTKGNTLTALRSMHKEHQPGSAERHDYVERETAILTEFIDLSKTLKDKFTPHLKLKNWQSWFMWE